MTIAVGLGLETTELIIGHRRRAQRSGRRDRGHVAMSIIAVADLMSIGAGNVAVGIALRGDRAVAVVSIGQGVAAGVVLLREQIATGIVR